MFIRQALGKSDEEGWLYLSIIILLAIAAVFTIAGGLSAVIWTDFVQTILMIIGALILMGTGEVSIYKFIIESLRFNLPIHINLGYNSIFHIQTCSI